MQYEKPSVSTVGYPGKDPGGGGGCICVGICFKVCFDVCLTLIPCFVSCVADCVSQPCVTCNFEIP